MLTIDNSREKFCHNVYNKYIASSYYVNEKYDEQCIKESSVELIMLDGLVGDLGDYDKVRMLNVDGEKSFINIINNYTTIIEGAAYKFKQSTPSLVWTITHNLGYMPSAPLVTDLDGNNIEGIVDNVSIVQMTITFSSPQTGYAYLS